MKKILTLLLVAVTLNVVAQKRGIPRVTGVEVVYTDQTRLRVIGTKSEYKTVVAETKKTAGTQPREATYIDYKALKSFRTALLPDGDTVTVKGSFEMNRNLKVVRTEKLLGWECQVSQTDINSNTIEIWHTNNLGFNGTPIPGVGVPDGLVLKIAVNGQPIIEAESTHQLTFIAELFPQSWGKSVTRPEYDQIMTNSVVKTVEVFDNEPIRFTKDPAPEGFDQPDHIYRIAGGTVILKRVKLPEENDGYNIYAQVSHYSAGDAYDRTGSVFVVPVGKEQSYLDAMSTRGLASIPAFVSDTTRYPGVISTEKFDVPVELMRFYTSFGIRGFNHIQIQGQNWADSVIYKTEVTHLAPLLRGEVWIGAYIGNWDPNGHRLSLKIKYHPNYEPEMPAKVMIPLFNTLNILEQAGQPSPHFFGNDSLRMEFNVPQNLKNARLVYITTGHGGWETGDEFTPKLNTIYMDGAKIFSIVPWREDCGSYRNLNPASGNFPNGLSSSDLSRSNWCPGMVTYPYYLPVGELGAGKHTISVKIPQGEPNGESSSYWCISGFIVGDRAE